MVKEETVKVKLLKSPADFTELLNMQTLQMQLDVFELIKKNLESYQEKFFESFTKSGKEILEYIPVEEHEKWFKQFKDEDCKNLEQYLRENENSWEYEKERLQYKLMGDEITETDYKKFLKKMKFTWDKRYIVDTKNKRLIQLDYGERRGHQHYSCKIKYKRKENDKLTVQFSYEWTPWHNNRGPSQTRNTYYHFDLVNNTYIGMSEDNGNQGYGYR